MQIKTTISGWSVDPDLRRARRLEKNARELVARGAPVPDYAAPRCRLSVDELAELLTSPEADRWRSRVRRRALARCQVCESTAEPLEVAHVVPVSKMIAWRRISTVIRARACRDLWRARNGRLLCVRCQTTRSPLPCARLTPGSDPGCEAPP